MKTPSADLHHLVHALNNKEIKRVKAYITHQLQLQIFNEVLKQDSYNESILTDGVARGISKSMFSTLKHDLYQKILHVLKSDNQNVSKALIVRSLLNDGSVLAKKGLYQQAKKPLVKAEKICRDFGLKVELLLVLDAQREVAQIITDVPFKQDYIQRIGPGIKEELKELETYFGLLQNYDELYLSGDARIVNPANNSVLEMVNELEGKDLSTLGPKTLVIYHQTLAMGYFKLDQRDKTWHHLKQVIRIYESETDLLENDLYDYLKVRLNVLSVAVVDENEERAGKVLDVLSFIEENYNKITSAEVMHIKVRCYVLLTEIYQVRGEYGKCLDAAKQAELICEKHKLTMLPLQTLVINFMSLQAHFCLGNHRESLAMVNAIINESFGGIRPDIRQFCKVAFLIIHYQLKNYEELAYYLNSASRYYRGKKSLIETEKLTIKLLKKLLKDNTDKRSAILQFRKSIQELNDNNTDGSLKLYFDFEFWIHKLLAELD